MFPVISQETLDLILNKKETAGIHLKDFKLQQPHMFKFMRGCEKTIRDKDNIMAFWFGVLFTYEHMQRAYEIEKMNQM